MGMFDTVYARCPKCGASIEFQSKAGPCELRRYTTERVPPEVAKDLLQDEEACGVCDTVVMLRAEAPIQRIKMVAVVKGAAEEWD